MIQDTRKSKITMLIDETNELQLKSLVAPMKRLRIPIPKEVDKAIEVRILFLIWFANLNSVLDLIYIYVSVLRSSQRTDEAELWNLQQIEGVRILSSKEFLPC